MWYESSIKQLDIVVPMQIPPDAGSGAPTPVFSGVFLWKVPGRRVFGGFSAGPCYETVSGYGRSVQEARRKSGANVQKPSQRDDFCGWKCGEG